MIETFYSSVVAEQRVRLYVLLTRFRRNDGSEFFKTHVGRARGCEILC